MQMFYLFCLYFSINSTISPVRVFYTAAALICELLNCALAIPCSHWYIMALCIITNSTNCITYIDLSSLGLIKTARPNKDGAMLFTSVTYL